MKNAKEAMRKAVESAGNKIASEQKSTAEQQATLKRYESVKNILGMSDESAESLYSQAYLLYNTGKYKDAMQVFRLLTLIDPTESKYIMGLAACFHMMKEYRTASSSYALVSVLDPMNPIPYYHSSDCHLQTGDKISAMTMLELAIKRAGDKPEFSTLKQRAQITLEGLKKELMSRSKE